MRKSRVLVTGTLIISIGMLGFVFRSHVENSAISAVTQPKKQQLTKSQIASFLGDSVLDDEFPSSIELDLTAHEKTRGQIQYSFDPHLQRTMNSLFEAYTPDYGAFVAIEANTGKIISMVSYAKKNNEIGNLALRASFPSASVFKVVTATAAIEGHKISRNTVIPFNGRNHTLYRGQILRNDVTRWTRFITLKDAFARSVNTVFGRIGAYTVGPAGLRLYADRFGFNRRIEADLPIQEGKAPIPEDAWGLAETASGFTRENTMSPLQGALIAASVANDGIMMEPYVVESIRKSDGELLYQAMPKVQSITMDAATAAEVRALMRETVTHGTSRSSFRGFFKKDYSFVDVGGKTGSLTGLDPHGKYDWFVGYAEYGARRIAFASLTIHKKQWRVKSSYLARKAIEAYFKPLAPPTHLGPVVTLRGAFAKK